MIIKESRYLDKLGFRIPESALNVTLQESKYQSISRSLTSKLQFYDQLISSLKPVEKILLKVWIENGRQPILTHSFTHSLTHSLKHHSRTASNTRLNLSYTNQN